VQPLQLPSEKFKVIERGCQKFGPICGLATFPEVGSGAIFSTLQNGYPRLQGLSQGKLQAMRPRTTTWPPAPDPTSQHRRAPELPHVLQLRTSPPSSGGLWCYRAFCSSRPRLLAWEGSGAAARFIASDPASQLGRAPVQSHAPRLRIPPSYVGGIRRCHMPHGS
jgi:hypothetical protein